jgi:hypothetical protein
VAGLLLLHEADGEGSRVSGGLKLISLKSLASGLACDWKQSNQTTSVYKRI